MLRDGRVGVGQIQLGQRNPLQALGEGAEPRANPSRRRLTAWRAWSSWTRSSALTRAPSGARPGRIRRRTPGCLTRFARSFAATPEAKARGYKENRFSFNVKGGRCEACCGDGMLKIEMHFLPDIYRALRRVQGQALQPRDAGGDLQGQEHLRRAGHEQSRRRMAFFENHARASAASSKRSTTSGLGYMKLGQPSTTLSGGEAQRVKLATELQPPRDGQDALYPGRADDRAAHGRRGQAHRAFCSA